MHASRLVIGALVLLASACSSKAPTPPPVDSAALMTKVLTEKISVADAMVARGAELDAVLDRQSTKLVGARADRRLPIGKVDSAEMRQVLTGYAKMHGLGAASLKLGTDAAGSGVPASHLGDEAYPYETAQLIATVPIAISVEGTDPARLQAFYAAAQKLQLPLMALPTLLVGAKTSTFSGSLYFRRDVATPRLTEPPPALDALAAGLDAPLPKAPDALASLTELHAQLAAKSRAVAEVKAKQDKVARQARVLQFLRTRSAEIAKQTAPKTLKAPAEPAP